MNALKVPSLRFPEFSGATVCTHLFYARKTIFAIIQPR